MEIMRDEMSHKREMDQMNCILFSQQARLASVGEWLMQLGLNQYEKVMMESGYDDIDFVSSLW